MMCGCKIEDHYWPTANFDIQALVTHNGQTAPVTLKYTGNPSEFSAPYEFASAGTYEISVLAVQTDGNLGTTGAVAVRVR
jgi:hypothetical protein